MKPTQDEQISAHTRTLKIIMLALAAGVFILSGVFATMAPMGAVDNFEIMVLIGLAGAAMAVAMRAVAPTLVAKSGLEQLAKREADNDVEQICGLFVSSRIVAAALLEGAAMLNVVVFFLAHNPLSLGVGVALGIAIAAHIPSRYQMVTFVEDHLRELQQRRATNW